MGLLDGKVAVVTGAGGGIGREIARCLASEGARVVVNDLGATLDGSGTAQGPAAETCRLIEEAGGTAVANGESVADFDGAKRIVDQAVGTFGSIDILVNNAATNPYYGPIIDLDTPRADKTVRVNQTGYLEWSRSAWRAGMSERGGVILNLASIGGLTVEGGIGWYNVTKAAVIHLTSQLAGELGPGVRVNALAPGLVKTELARALWESGGESIAARLPLRRLGEVEDIANAALFLCSDAASWITGHTLVIDGGALCIASGGLS